MPEGPGRTIQGAEPVDWPHDSAALPLKQGAGPGGPDDLPRRDTSLV